jgi:hypothetical protein
MFQHHLAISAQSRAIRYKTTIRWFRLWVGTGVALALGLLAVSISTYVAVSHEVILAHVRANLASQAAAITQQIEHSAAEPPELLAKIANETIGRSSGRIAAVAVRDSDGVVIVRAGASEQPAFSASDVRSHIQTRRPLFKVAGPADRRIVAEVFPFLLPASAAPSLAGHYSGPFRLPFATIEIAELWDGSDAPLWPLKRQIAINVSAALVLLASLIVLGLRFPAYLRGREIEQEIEIARSVQRDLLPPTTCDLDDFQVAGGYSPVAGVSGDFYDTFSVHGERVAFVLGDVAGKGIPAALLMGVLHGAVRSSEWTNSPLDHLEATRQMNRLLCERAASERFATMFWSYFNPETRHLRYVNAGHCPPLLVKRSRRSPILRLTCGGPVLGMLAGTDYDQGSVRLDHGDCLILYSDGIIEAANEAGDQFGEDRLLETVRTHAGESAIEIRDHILEAIDQFRGAAAPDDDRTLVVAVYRAPKQAEDTVDWRARQEVAC